jgi:uncharacterized membrane protein
MESSPAVAPEAPEHRAPVPRTRDRGIDALRGLAILLMIMANSAPHSMAEPFPLWFRFVSSLAAPLFVMLAGFMVAYTSSSRGYGIQRFLVRGALVAASGVALDLFVYGIYPATSFDILYLLAVTLPVAYLVSRWPTAVAWLLAALVFGLTPLLQGWLGYTPDPTEIYFMGEPSPMAPVETGIPQHILVDGWFPLFPWLGFGILGVALARLRKAGHGASLWFGGVGLALLVGGLAFWKLFPGLLLPRGGYVELFYPPTLGFALTFSGLLLTLLWAVTRFPPGRLFDPAYAVGEASITVYLVHLVLIVYVLEAVVDEPGSLGFFFLHSAWLTAACLGLGYLLRAVRKHYRSRNTVVRFYLGG